MNEGKLDEIGVDRTSRHGGVENNTSTVGSIDGVDIDHQNQRLSKYFSLGE